jgi:2-polyprenyl-3-methyl-5-hydroxy-6-metoxy-1,4-benzoquinol methylase
MRIYIFKLLNYGKIVTNECEGMKLYKNYITTIFGEIHSINSLNKEFEIYRKYYQKNYLKYMPSNKDGKILDVGSGMGHFLYFLEREGYRNYLGIDISEECVNFCKKLGFRVKLSDAIKFLRDTNKAYDCIVINDLLEHFTKTKIIKFLKLCHNALKEGGIIIIKTINCSNPILGTNSRYGDFTHETGFTETSLSQILKLVDFKNIRIYPQDIYIFYYNPLNYIAKGLSKMLNLMFRLLFYLYGKKSIKIFTKMIIAIAEK